MSRAKPKSQRNDSDYYPTPWEAFLPLIPYLNPNWRHWEPACGDGRLVEWMAGFGISADGDDILRSGNSFLDDFSPRDVIITNPPFSLAQQFISHARCTSVHEVWMLLRINLLAGGKRKKWWKENKPDCLFILSDRPSFDELEGGTDATEYAWYYWGSRYSHLGGFEWL